MLSLSRRLSALNRTRQWVATAAATPSNSYLSATRAEGRTIHQTQEPPLFTATADPSTDIRLPTLLIIHFRQAGLGRVTYWAPRNGRLGPCDTRVSQAPGRFGSRINGSGRRCLINLDWNTEFPGRRRFLGFLKVDRAGEFVARSCDGFAFPQRP